MSKTSTEVKHRYNSKTYKRIQVYFRYDTDGELLDFIELHKESIGVAQIFREALEHYIEEVYPNRKQHMW